MARKNNRAIRNLRNDTENTGGYFGGTRGRLPDRQLVSQTTFDRGYPILPEPQPILSMPKQLAIESDKWNEKGKIASTANVNMAGSRFRNRETNAEKFLHDINTVYVNPLYQNEYIKPAGSADTKERRAKKYESVRAGIDQFAKANTKYFDKKFKVLPYPKNDYSNKFNGEYANPMKTLQIDVSGTYAPGEYWAGMASMRYLDYPTKGRGADAGQPIGPYQNDITVNSAWKQRPQTWAHIVQHEFGHNLGFGHSEDYEDGDKNTGMSYDSSVYDHGAKLFPSDINKFQDLYRQRDIRKRAKNAYKGVAKNRK
jgi:hypothetical protein